MVESSRRNCRNSASTSISIEAFHKYWHLVCIMKQSLWHVGFKRYYSDLRLVYFNILIYQRHGRVLRSHYGVYKSPRRRWGQRRLIANETAERSWPRGSITEPCESTVQAEKSRVIERYVCKVRFLRFQWRSGKEVDVLQRTNRMTMIVDARQLWHSLSTVVMKFEIRKSNFHLLL